MISTLLLLYTVYDMTAACPMLVICQVLSVLFLLWVVYAVAKAVHVIGGV